MIRKRHALCILSHSIAVYTLIIITVLTSSFSSSLSDSISKAGMNVRSLQILDPTENSVIGICLMENKITDYCEVSIGKAGDITVVFCDEKLFSLLDLTVRQGELFTAADINDNVPLVVMGREVWVSNGYPARYETININGVTFTVLGVLDSRAEALVLEIDDSVFVPEGYGLIIETESSWLYRSERDISKSLEETFGKDSFIHVDYSAIRETADGLLETAGTVLKLLGMVAVVISLLGIMSSMLNTLDSRMQETGIKKALGAGNKDIFMEFMAENAIVLFAGDLIAVVAVLVTITTIGSVSDIEFEPLDHLGMIFRISVFGLIMGMYPAWKASRMTIMDTIRRNNN